MASIILGYRVDSCYGCLTEPGGWSFDIFSKGTVRFKTYLMNGEATSSTKDTLPKSVIDNIYLTLQNWRADISRLPKETNNHSCDGSYHSFKFLGSKITSLNISRHEDVGNVEYEKYYDEEYIQTLQTENTVLQIFESACKFLSPFGLQVEIEPSFYCCWNGHTGCL